MPNQNCLVVSKMGGLKMQLVIIGLICAIQSEAVKFFSIDGGIGIPEAFWTLR
jgi:hypothetical protein